MQKTYYVSLLSILVTVCIACVLFLESVCAYTFASISSAFSLASCSMKAIMCLICRHKQIHGNDKDYWKLIIETMALKTKKARGFFHNKSLPSLSVANWFCYCFYPSISVMNTVNAHKYINKIKSFYSLYIPLRLMRF